MPTRRFEHAHRVRQPVGSLDGARALHVHRRRRSTAGPAGLTLALAVIALAAVAVRPWDGLIDPASRGDVSGDAIASPVTGVGDGAAGGDGPEAGGAPGARPSLGPHGDPVAVADPPDADIATARHSWLAGIAGPLPPAFLTGYVWPIRNARITNTYGLDRPGSFVVDGTPFHDGLDISSFCGARITAAHDGVVLVAGRRAEAYLGWVGDLEPFRARVIEQGGWRSQAITVVTDDGNGYRSIYAHLGLAVVEPGEVVRAGDLLGYEGASGNATGCHLHYAIYSPREGSTLALDPKVARKTRLPGFEIARIDPLLVLPPLAEAGIAWNWGAR